MIIKQYRHGDVLIEEVSEIPTGAKKTGKIVMEGEVTGHAHRLGRGAFVLETTEGERYIEVTAPTSPLKHEEHKRIDLPKGNYRVIRQREYDPYEGVRNVQD